MLIYPVLLVANLNRTFFLVISCLMFPQIYVNGQTGHRPDPASPYYLNFLFIRFVIVVSLCLFSSIFEAAPLTYSIYNLITCSAYAVSAYFSSKLV